MSVMFPCKCHPGHLVFDGVMLQLDLSQAQQAFNSVIDVHHEGTVMTKWSSIWVWGFGFLPVLEKHQQVVPPHLAIFPEAHSAAASRLLGAFE